MMYVVYDEVGCRDSEHEDEIEAKIRAYQIGGFVKSERDD